MGFTPHYGATEKYLIAFIQETFRADDVQLAQINYAFVLNFENYLLTCKPLMKSQPLNNNGIMKHMERFKKMTTIACKLDCIKKDPFAFFVANFTPYDRPILTMEELRVVEELVLEDIGLEKVRDVFVFACYTGFSYVDTKNLKLNQVALGIDGDEWVFARREKTKTLVRVPLLETAKAILRKYGYKGYGVNEDLLLPVYSNQKCNEYLKIIAAMCKIKKNVTFHVARHTFATSVTLTNGVPIETVSKLLGHKKLATTQIYSRVVERKISSDMAVLKKMLSSNQALV